MVKNGRLTLCQEPVLKKRKKSRKHRSRDLKDVFDDMQFSELKSLREMQDLDMQLDSHSQDDKEECILPQVISKEINRFSR